MQQAVLPDLRTAAIFTALTLLLRVCQRFKPLPPGQGCRAQQLDVVFTAWRLTAPEQRLPTRFCHLHILPAGRFYMIGPSGVSKTVSRNWFLLNLLGEIAQPESEEFRGSNLLGQAALRGISARGAGALFRPVPSILQTLGDTNFSCKL
jgi:hypothetical protein